MFGNIRSYLNEDNSSMVRDCARIVWKEDPIYYNEVIKPYLKANETFCNQKIVGCFVDRLKNINGYLDFLPKAYFNFSGNKVDLSELIGLDNLQEIRIEGSELINKECIEGFKDLHTLSLLKCNIEDLDWVMDCYSVRNLSLGFNKIKCVEPMRYLNNLKSITLYNNQIESFEPLFNLNMTSLCIQSNNIKNYNAKKDFPNVEFLRY